MFCANPEFEEEQMALDASFESAHGDSATRAAYVEKHCQMEATQREYDEFFASVEYDDETVATLTKRGRASHDAEASFSGCDLGKKKD